MGGEFIDGRIYNATQNRYHSYFLFDDRQVGNLGNDGIDRIDYVKELAQNQAPAGARNDDRHKRFTPVGGVDFDQNYQPINSLYPTAAPGSYIVKAGETLQSIATAVWGDGAMWYLLADANGLAPNQPLIANTVLTVPNKVTNIHNNAGTFKPYDAGSAMGNTSPTLPEPPPPPAPKKGGCGGFVKVLAIVVMVVVTIYTAGIVSAAMAPGAMTAGAWGFGAAMGAGMSAGAGALAAGAAIGSIASQAVLIAGGEQDKFSWKQVGIAAAGAYITGGITGLEPIKQGLSALPGWGQAVATGAINNVASQGVNIVAGEQSGFDWKNLAISAASAGVGYAVAQGIGRLQYGGEVGWGDAMKSGAAQREVGKRLTRNFLGGFANSAAGAAARGNLNGTMLAQLGLEAVAFTIGNSVAEDAAARQFAFEGAVARSEQRMQNISASLGEANLASAVGDAMAKLQSGADNVLRAGVEQRMGQGNARIGRDFDRSWAAAEMKALVEAQAREQAIERLKPDFRDVRSSVSSTSIIGTSAGSDLAHWLRQVTKGMALPRYGGTRNIDFGLSREFQTPLSGTKATGEARSSVLESPSPSSMVSLAMGGTPVGVLKDVAVQMAGDLGVAFGIGAEGTGLDGRRFKMHPVTGEALSNKEVQDTRFMTLLTFVPMARAETAVVNETKGILSSLRSFFSSGTERALGSGERSLFNSGNLSSVAGSAKAASAAAPGAKVAIGGVEATQIAGRLTPAEMAALQRNAGTEFAQIYITGPGRNGGGAYYLIQGVEGGVNIPIGSNVRWINHTHPEYLNGNLVPLRASGPDRNVLKLLQQAGSPQMRTQIVPQEAQPFYFWRGN